MTEGVCTNEMCQYYWLGKVLMEVIMTSLTIFLHPAICITIQTDFHKNLYFISSLILAGMLLIFIKKFKCETFFVRKIELQTYSENFKKYQTFWNCTKKLKRWIFFSRHKNEDLKNHFPYFSIHFLIWLT